MVDHAEPTGKPDASSEASMQLAVASKDSAPFVTGRREFFMYRDLGVAAATNGGMRAQVQHATRGMSKPTGWHYHVCEYQFNYMLSGWVDLEFEDGTTRRMEAGTSFFIPPGFKHNEIRTSESFEVIEITLPADMGTVACDVPDSWIAAQAGKATTNEQVGSTAAEPSNIAGRQTA
jgi:quercetin dioxygenase-like cupin family protein